MEIARKPITLPIKFLLNRVALFGLMIAGYYLVTDYIQLRNPIAKSSEINLNSVILALETGNIPSEEEVLIWEQLLQRLKNQIDAGIPLTQAQIDQLQSLYNLTKAYIPWMENLFELIKSIIQQITLDNAALELELSQQPNHNSDE